MRQATAATPRLEALAAWRAAGIPQFPPCLGVCVRAYCPRVRLNGRWRPTGRRLRPTRRPRRLLTTRRLRTRRLLPTRRRLLPTRSRLLPTHPCPSPSQFARLPTPRLPLKFARLPTQRLPLCNRPRPRPVLWSARRCRCRCPCRCRCRCRCRCPRPRLVHSGGRSSCKLYARSCAIFCEHLLFPDVRNCTCRISCERFTCHFCRHAAVGIAPGVQAE